MAIDVIARPGILPMIICDAGDPVSVTAIAFDDRRASASLVCDATEGVRLLPLSARLVKAITRAETAVLVVVGPTGKPVSARLLPLGDSDLPPVEIDDETVDVLLNAAFDGPVLRDAFRFDARKT